MSISTNKQIELNVNTDEFGVELSVFDGKGNTYVRTKNNSLELKLPRGLYTLRAERNGEFKDTILRLTEACTVTPDLPARYSAIPLPGAETTHEYYSYSSWEISQNYTSDDIVFNGDLDSSLMLFMRAPEQSKVTSTKKTSDLLLRALDGRVLTDFDEANINLDHTHGYVGFSARMSSGDVILEDYSEHPRQTRLPLLQGFQTQIFLMYLGRPLYEDIRVLTVDNGDISTRKNRDPYTKDKFAEIADQVDIGMTALQNNVEDVGKSLVNYFLTSKFRNPLLGLLGAYLMLLRRHQRPEIKYNDRLPKTVIRNLQKLIPGSPDLVALKHLAEPWLGEPVDEEITMPPLFRVGADTLIRAAARRSELIPEGCLFDAVSDRILADSAWTTWTSIPLPLNHEVQIASPAREEKALSWVELAVADSLTSAKKQLNIEDLAERIGVTQRSINKAFTNLTTQALQSPNVFKQEGLDPSLFQEQTGQKSRINVRGEFDYLPETSARSEHDVSRISFQGIYPTLKEVLSEYSGKNTQISAEDKLEDLIKTDNIDDMRNTLLKRMQAKYPSVTLTEMREGFDELETVRDLANLVVKKQSI